MVCLNEVLPFNKIILRNNIYNGLQEKIRLEFAMELDEKIIERINKNIQKNVKEMFGNNHFLYLNIDENHCVHMFKKGKKEGYYCTKRIKTNIPKDSKKDYLCCSHSKQHIPRKKNNKKIYENSKNFENSVIREKNKFIISNFNKTICKNNNKNRILKKKLKRNNKIFICNGGIFDFKNIFNNIL